MQTQSDIICLQVNDNTQDNAPREQRSVAPQRSVNWKQSCCLCQLNYVTFYSLPGGVRSIAMRMSVCLSLRLHNSKTTRLNITNSRACSLWTWVGNYSGCLTTSGTPTFSRWQKLVMIQFRN